MAYAKGAGATYVGGFLPRPISKIHNINPILHQALGYICSLCRFVPKADVYLITAPDCLASLAFRKKNFKVILINDGPFFYILEREKNQFKRKYMLHLLNQVDGIISPTEMMKKQAEPFTKGIPNEVVPLFVDTNRYGKIKADLSSPNVSCFARPYFLKGTDILVKAFKLIKKEYKEANLYVGGKGPMIKKFRDVPGVHMPGFCKPEKYLSKSGLYINAARLEPFGVNILEAMCAGIPPIVSENCGAKEIVAKVDPSLIVKCNPNAIAKRAIGLHESRDKEELGKKCRKIAMKYTRKRTIRMARKAFRKMLSELK